MEVPLRAKPDRPAYGAAQPTPPQPKINHRHEAEDWVLSLEVASELTPSEHKVMIVLARRCNSKVGFEPQPVLYSFCAIRTRKEYIGILNQLGMSHHAYLQHTSNLQRKGFLFKSSQPGSHGRGNINKDITKRRVSYTRWRLPVPLLELERQEPLFRTHANGNPDSDMRNSHAPIDSDMRNSHVPIDSDMRNSHVPMARPLLHLISNRDEISKEPPFISTMQGDNGGGEGGGSFCSDFLIPAFENVGLAGFTEAALAFMEPAAARFADIHGEPPGQDVATCIADRLVKFIEQENIDVSAEPHRILSANGGYLRNTLVPSVLEAGMSLRFKPPEPEPEAAKPWPEEQPRANVEADWDVLHTAHVANLSRTKKPGQIWDAALGEIQLRVARPAFETWLRDTDGVGITNDAFYVGTVNEFVSEMLQNRLYPLIERAVEQVVGAPLSIRFIVVPGRIDHSDCPLCEAS